MKEECTCQRITELEEQLRKAAAIIQRWHRLAGVKGGETVTPAAPKKNECPWCGANVDSEEIRKGHVCSL